MNGISKSPLEIFSEKTYQMEKNSKYLGNNYNIYLLQSFKYLVLQCKEKFIALLRQQ